MLVGFGRLVGGVWGYRPTEPQWFWVGLGSQAHVVMLFDILAPFVQSYMGSGDVSGNTLLETLLVGKAPG